MAGSGCEAALLFLEPSLRGPVLIKSAIHLILTVQRIHGGADADPAVKAVVGPSCVDSQERRVQSLRNEKKKDCTRLLRSIRFGPMA